MFSSSLLKIHSLRFLRVSISNCEFHISSFALLLTAYQFNIHQQSVHLVISSSPQLYTLKSIIPWSNRFPLCRDTYFSVYVETYVVAQFLPLLNLYQSAPFRNYYNTFPILGKIGCIRLPLKDRIPLSNSSIFLFRFTLVYLHHPSNQSTTISFPASS